jgi:WD40 repeat protein
LQGHTARVACLAFSPDGAILVSGDAAGKIKLWDAELGLERLSLDGHTRAITALAFSPNGATLASGDASGAIRLWRGQ